MSLLRITEIAQVGEHRWGISLTDDTGKPILQSTDPLAKGVALSTAKVLKHKGPDAPVLVESPGRVVSAWVPEKTDLGWQVRFTLVSETVFDLLLKSEDATGDIKVVENALETVKANLVKAEIKWDPPEADPAYKEKESDLTPAIGYPGS